MSYYPCAHKAANDHSVIENGARVWTCSFCAARGQWTEGWSYHGNIECTTCHAARIDEVRCPGCPPPNEAQEGASDAR